MPRTQLTDEEQLAIDQEAWETVDAVNSHEPLLCHDFLRENLTPEVSKTIISFIQHQHSRDSAYLREWLRHTLLTWADEHARKNNHLT